MTFARGTIAIEKSLPLRVPQVEEAVSAVGQREARANDMSFGAGYRAAELTCGQLVEPTLTEVLGQLSQVRVAEAAALAVALTRGSRVVVDVVAAGAALLERRKG